MNSFTVGMLLNSYTGPATEIEIKGKNYNIFTDKKQIKPHYKNIKIKYWTIVESNTTIRILAED